MSRRRRHWHPGGGKYAGARWMPGGGRWEGGRYVGGSPHLVKPDGRIAHGRTRHLIDPREHAARLREHERLQRQEAQYRRELQRAEREAATEARREIRDFIRGNGGITPHRTSTATGEGYHVGEWKSLPRWAKSSERRGRGMPLDLMAQAVSSEFPWLGVETGDDLADYLQGDTGALAPRRRGRRHATPASSTAPVSSAPEHNPSGAMYGDADYEAPF